MTRWRVYPKVRRGVPPVIDQRLLVVRGARYCSKAIQELLVGPTPQSPDAPDPKLYPALSRHQQNLSGDFIATLRPCGPDHEAYEHDPFAVEVLVGDSRVGYIQKRSAREVRRIILPYYERGIPVELPCTVFWNGDENADFQFYSVQLFS